VIVTELVPGVVPELPDIELPPQAPIPKTIATARIAIPNHLLEAGSFLRRFQRPRSAPSPGNTSA
jgi:hypothetical protein